jgi:ACS family hexuronate transporter-like MFS transporter
MPINLKPGIRRWFIVGIIFLAMVFNYTDRQIIAILKPLLKKEFNIGNDGYALLLNVFTICYAAMYLVTGWLVDKFGARLVMFFGIIGWSVACIGGGISRSLTQFTFFRGMLGMAEPSNYPAQLRVVTIWFSGKLRATANSLCVAGGSIGAIIAPPLVAWIALTYNWQTVFIVSGCVGLLIAILWILVYQDPPKQVLTDAFSLNVVPQEKAFSWAELWGTKSLWGILLIRFISDPVWYFCLFWLPGYLQEQSGLSLKTLGMVGWIPFLAADLGAIALSAWSDRMVRNGGQPLKSRKVMLTTTAMFAPMCALVPFLSNVASTLLVFSIIAVICLSWLFNLSVVIAEAFPAKNVASVLGIAGSFGAAGAVLFNYIVGQFIGKVGANNLFFAMAILHPIAVLILWKMIRPEIPKAVQLV